MGLFIDHVNVVLSKLRADPVAAISADTTTDAYRAQIAVNRAVQRIWNKAPWTFLRRTATFNTVSAQGDYNLDKTIGRVFEVLSANPPYKLELLSRLNLDKQDPQRKLTGDPVFGAITDVAPVAAQPSSSSILQISSSNAGDTTQLVLVKGIVSGEVAYEQVALNGTVAVFTTNAFSAILGLAKSATTVGKVTVQVGASVLATIGPIEKTVYIRTLTLYPVPTAVIQMTVRHYAPFFYMNNAYEPTGIPDQWDYVVDQWAFCLALQAKGQDQSGELQQELLLATKMLDEDMSGEEVDSEEDPVVLEDAGRGLVRMEGLWLSPSFAQMES